MYARPFIDSLDFARNGQSIRGELPVAELSRLQDLLETRQGVLSYSVRGGVDNQGSRYLDVNVTGRCLLRCQRCLEALDYQVGIVTRLLLRDQPTLEVLELDAAVVEEEFDSILADPHLDVLNLLEDEVLLSLPIAPKHEPGACQAAGGGNRQQEERHPFAVLEKLKRH